MDARDRTLRVVILPAAPTTAPLVDLFRNLLGQSLIDPPILLVDESGGTRTLAAIEADDEVVPLRDRIEASRCERFLLINVITADSVSAERPDEGDVAPELRMALEVDLFIRNSLAAKVGAGEESRANQELDVVNLVIPAAAERSVPSDLHSGGPHNVAVVRKWWNVVVAPEVQETTAQATVPVTPDEDYVAHVAASVISVAGCWSGAAWEPEFPAYEPAMWTVVRSRSRSLLAPELPNRVLGRIGRSAGRLPVDDEIDFQVAPEPSHAVDLARAGLIRRRSLDHAPFTDVSFRPPPRRVSVGEFFRIIWRWITGRLPGLVLDGARERVDEIRNNVDRMVNRGLGLDDESEFKVRLIGTDDPSPAGAVEAPEAKERIWAFLHPEPEVWSEMRGLSFGMLDGGAVPDEQLRRLLGPGNQRFVLGDRSWICPSPDVALFEPSQATRDLGIGPSATRHVVDIEWADAWEAAFEHALGVEEEAATPVAEATEGSDPVKADRHRFTMARAQARTTFLWGLGEHLGDQRKAIVERLGNLREQLAEANEVTAEQVEKETKATKRRAWVWLAVNVAVLLALAVGFVWGVQALAIGGAVLIAASVVAGLLWLWRLMSQLWRCVYAWFLADHRRFWLLKGRVQVLEEAIAHEEIQLRRFGYLCFAHKEWCEVIATLCYHPFRQPVRNRVRRVRAPELGLPSSHGIAEGMTTAPRLDGIVSAVAAGLIRPGWLGDTFGSALEYAAEEHRLRTRGGRYDPDGDLSSGSDTIGPRRALVDAIVAGRARHRRELEVMRDIHRSIRTGSGFLDDPAEAERPVVDRLFTSLPDGRSPEEFLEEAVSGPPSNFNREFTPFDRTPERAAALASDVVELPELPSVEAMIEGASVEFPPLVFSRWSIEACEGVAIEGLSVFADQPSPVTIDLSKALTKWKPPPEVDEFEPPASVDLDRSGWVLDGTDLPVLGQLITPDPGARNWALGPFRYMIEIDGEPVSHPLGAPIKYAVRSDCAPPGAMNLVTRALQCISNVTGHEFAFDGTFTQLPRQGSDRIEIGWAFSDEFTEWQARHEPDADAKVIGWGGTRAAPLPDRSGLLALSGGIVLLRADTGYELGFTSGFSHGEVLLHELGHVMNLDHVSDPNEIMCPASPALQSPLDLGPGDSAGLRQLAAIAPRV